MPVRKLQPIAASDEGPYLAIDTHSGPKVIHEDLASAYPPYVPPTPVDDEE